MRRQRDLRIERLRAIEKEFQVISLALQILRRLLTTDPSALRPVGLKRSDLHRSMGNLEATYLIRLFAEFETGLRECWNRRFNKKTHPRTVDLLTAVATRCSIPQDWRDRVHEVRVYRNQLVHEDDADVVVVPVPIAAQALRRFFSFLPSHW